MKLNELARAVKSLAPVQIGIWDRSAKRVERVFGCDAQALLAGIRAVVAAHEGATRLEADGCALLLDVADGYHVDLCVPLDRG